MLRTFREHDLRRVDALDGRWELAVAGGRQDPAALPEAYPRTIQVPSAWECLPGLERYRGTAWLRTRFRAVEGRAVRLVFGGVSHTGTVFVDGRRVGDHYDAFTPWAVVVPDLSPGEHELVVAVDNSFGEHSALHIENDYMTYGGITRPVELHHVPAVFLERMSATPRRTGDRWALDLRVRLANWSQHPLERSVVAEVAGTQVALGALRVAPGETAEATATFDGLAVEPWSPRHPRLYELAARLLDGETAVDDLIDRVGFREVRVAGEQLLVNDEAIRLRGYNRHEDHPQFGNAIPLAGMAADLELIRDQGCNFVRTSHYPNDLRFLDLCDEMGFYVWEESHARTVDFDHPAYREQITRSTVEMVEWHGNRPSIIMWGCLNECDSVSEAGQAEHARVLQLLRELDPSRPVTFATNKPFRDRSLRWADICALNIYIGWYDGEPADIEPEMERILAWLDSPASEGGAGKPVILSEFGAGAVPGYRDPRRCHWSEEYQCDVLDEALRVYLGHPRISGAAVWQFCDVRLTPGWWHKRPRTMNNKGTVDEHRRPKPAYAVVKRRMLASAAREDER